MTVHTPDTQAYAILTGPYPARIDHVLSITETSFVQAGMALEEASHALHALEDMLPRLQAGLGTEADQAFAASVDSLQLGAASLMETLQTFVRRTGDLDRTTMQVNREIADLDRIVRTIATLSITARVLGHAIVPPEPKVAAFVENLSGMALEAEETLGEVKAAMTDIRHEIEQIIEAVEDIQNVLASQVFGLLSVLTDMARHLLSRRPELAGAGEQFARDMSRSAAEVSRLIVALQIGDSFRQRLGRVRATLLAMVTFPSDHAVALGHDLAGALLTAARDDMEHEVRAAIQALHDLEVSSVRAIDLARRVYLRAGDDARGQNEMNRTAQTLDARLSDVDKNLSDLRCRTDQLVQRIQDMLSRERVLRQIAHKVRLAGLNAVVICTQLGHRGNALREVAQWLRGITDDADAATQRLQGELDVMRKDIAEVGQNGLLRLSERMSDVVLAGGALQQQIGRMHDVIAQASGDITRIGKSFPVLVAPAKLRLSNYLEQTKALDGLSLELQMRRLAWPERLAEFPAGSEEHTLFQALRERYTMALERQIHDRIMAGCAPEGITAAVAAEPETPAAQEDVDDLDDILF